jgi:hypothetical protein
MSRAVPFTQASLCRAIAAAKKSGLRVTGIRPDGTVIVTDEPANDLAFDDLPRNDAPNSWEGVG